MDAIMTLLTDTLGPFGPVMVAAVLGVGMILFVVIKMMNEPEDPLAKLKKSAAASGSEAKGGRLRSRSSSADNLEKYANFLEPQNEEELSAIRLKLMQAGYQSKNAVRVYHFAQFALGVLFLLGGVAFAIYQTQTGEPETKDTLLAILIPGAIGYLAPKYWVTRRQQERQEAITDAFPDSLDMMLVCVEAGQSLDQSILRVSKELKSGYPDLANEFEIVSHEMKAGKDKTNVLKDMSERCGVADIASFVTVLIQSQQFGTSIAEALRVYSAEMRDKRIMRAEEKANQLPTKMTLATMMLTVPPLLLILIGPSVFNIAETLGQYSQ